MPGDWIKRGLDLVLAGTALIAGAPVLALAAAAIKLDSPGPVLFAQERVGKGRRPIRALKLRTMVVDAEARGLGITAAGDPRVTRVGRWLRRTKLDELPQLWNIVRGDMSVVGPRPEIPRYVARYRPEWDALFSVRPGLTDLASLTFRDEEALLAGAHDRERAYTDVIMPLKLELALAGVAASSVRHDVDVIVRTALAIVRGGDPRAAATLAEARRRIAELDQPHEDVA